jgi:hypothetical protein
MKRPPATKSFHRGAGSASRRKLKEAFPYVVVDARYEKVREGGTIENRAVQIALGIDWEGRRQVLAVEYARLVLFTGSPCYNATQSVPSNTSRTFTW